LLVIDDGSTDRSVRKVREINDESTSVIQQENKRVSAVST